MLGDILNYTIGPALGLVSSISCIIFLNTYLKELHDTLKTLLNILFIHNAITLTIALIIYDPKTFVPCFVRTLMIAPAFTLTIMSVSVMSYTRYYITLKTQKGEAIDEVKLKILVAYCYLGELDFQKLLTDPRSLNQPKREKVSRQKLILLSGYHSFGP